MNKHFTYFKKIQVKVENVHWV